MTLRDEIARAIYYARTASLARADGREPIREKQPSGYFWEQALEAADAVLTVRKVAMLQPKVRKKLNLGHSIKVRDESISTQGEE